MFKPLLLAAVFVAATVPVAPQAQADGLSIDLLPGVSLRIGDQDRRGNYWDGYDWRDRDWWESHRGRELGERSRRGYYWDGYRWRDHDYWRKNYYYHDGRYRKYDEHEYKRYKKYEKAYRKYEKEREKDYRKYQKERYKEYEHHHRHHHDDD